MLSVVLPTFNEASNLPDVLARLGTTLAGRPHEIIVVDDDSPDRTWEIAEGIARKDASVRVLRRQGRRGLASAVTEGFALARGETLLVMDADGQHDPAVVLGLADRIAGGADLAVASRYAAGGDLGGWRGIRPLLSRAGTALARRLPRVRVSDPMSGFFAVRSDAYARIADRLRPTGFKILLELLAHLPADTRVSEVPLHFGLRKYGESKLSLTVQLEFLAQAGRILLLRAASSPWQWIIAVALATALALAFALRLSPLLPLYLHPAARARVQADLRRVTDAEGWLLSDIELLAVSDAEFSFLLRRHHRGADEEACYVVPYGSRPQPCAKR